jgi:hypothetical protein
MSRAVKDFRGQRFGDLTAIDDSGKRHHGELVWLCSCSCPLENQVEVSGYELRHGHTRSCAQKADFVNQIRHVDAGNSRS